MTREELEKLLQQAIDNANNANAQVGSQPVSTPVTVSRPTSRAELDALLDNAIKTYQPRPVQPVQVTPVVQEPPKQNILQKAGSWVSGLFKKKEDEEQDVSKSLLKPILEDKYNKLKIEQENPSPRIKKVQNLMDEIKEIEVAMNDTSEKGMGSRIMLGQKYSSDRNISQFKGAMVGLAKSIFDSVASLYEMQFKKDQDFANKQEELIKQGFADLNIPESEQQALLEKYSPRYQKVPGRPLDKTLKEKEDLMKKNLEEGRVPFQKTMQIYIDDMSPTNPTFADQLVQGIGSMAGFYVATVLTGGGAIIPAVLESMGEAGTVYEENKANGKPVNEAFTESGKTFVANLVWNAVLNKFSGLFENIGEPAIKSVKEKVIKTVNAGTWEGIQEAGQQLISNFNTGKEDIWEGVFESLGLGAIIGSGAMVGEISTGVDVSPTTEVTPTTAGATEEVKPTSGSTEDRDQRESEITSKVDQNLRNLEVEINDLNRSVETIREYMNMPTQDEGKKYITTSAVETLMGTGVTEMKFDENGNITLYRDGVVTPGEANSFSLEKKFDTQKAYTVNKDEIAINTTSKEFADLYKQVYKNSKMLDIALETLKKWNTNEAEIIVVPKKKGIQQPQVKKNATQGIVEPQVKRGERAVSQQKQPVLTGEPQQDKFIREVAKKYPDGVILYHQTSKSNLESILKNGLRAGGEESGVYTVLGKESSRAGGGDTVNVKIKVPLDQLQKLYPEDATYYSKDVGDNADLLFRNYMKANKELTGGDIIFNGSIPKEWVQVEKKTISSKKPKSEGKTKKVQVKDTKANRTRTFVKKESNTVESNEKALRDTYKKNEEKVYEALGEIFMEMDMAEAGQRLFVEQYDSSESKIIGISSTFPKWIPEDLRSKKLFDAVLGNIATIEDLSYPTGNRTAQRALYDEILSEVDSRTGLDTGKYRNAILDLYDKGIKQTTKTADKRLEGRKGTPKVSEEKPQAKEVTDSDILKYVKKRTVKFRDSGTVENLVDLAKESKSLEDFIKSYESGWLFHGSQVDLGDAPTLKRGYGYGDGQFTGQDMGGIFFTSNKKYALQYSNYGENSLYRYKLPKDIKVFDIRDPKHRAEFVTNSKNWEDYDSKEDAKKDAFRMLEDMKESTFAGAVDWATASQYIENLRQSGFDGARFLERRGDLSLREDGGFTVTGDPIYSYALFSIDEVPVQRALTTKQLTDIYDQSKGYDKSDRELLTFHNLRAEGFLKADKMGGIPVPSLAITKSNIPFEGFGEITLVGGKEFAYDEVFASDAYTKRVPPQQYEINIQEKMRLLKEIEPYQKQTGEEKYRGLYTAFDDSGSTPTELIRRASNSSVARAMFLKEEMGIDIGENLKDKNISKDISNGQLGLGTRAMSNSEKLLKIIRSGDTSKIESVEREDRLENPEKWERVTNFYRDLIDDAYNGTLKEMSGTDYAQEVADEYRARLEETFFSNGEIIPPATYNFSYRARDYAESGSTEVDTDKVKSILDKHFEKIDSKVFDKWVMGRFGGIFGRSYFIDSAGRKKLYSLENIMNYMTGRIRGQENFFYGAGSIKSKISKKLSGVDEIVANKESLKSEEETKKIHDELQDELGQLIAEIKDKSKWSSTESFGIYDEIGKDLATVGTSITPSRVRSALHRAGVSDPSTDLVEKTQDYLKRLQSAPVNYFEVKPQRVVQIKEFKGALVPNDIDPEIKKNLQEYGLKVVEYDPNVPGDRSIKAQLSFKGEMFRVKDDVKKMTGRTITDEQEQQLIDLNKRIFGDDNVKITLQIMANRRALGSYYDRIIQIVDGQVDPKDTYYHETVHKYLDVFTTQAEQLTIFKEGVKKYGTQDLAQVEERLAEDFVGYAKSREGVTGKIRSIFDSVLSRIRKYLNASSAIDEMYQQILTPVNQKSARKAESKEKVPVGKGEVKDSALFARTKEQLLFADPTKYEFDDNTGKYNVLNLEEDAQKAVSYLENNPEKAIAVSLGIVDAPAGQTATGIGLATALKARDEGNFKLYTDVMNSVSLRATRMGQEIVTLRGQFNDDSAENYVKRVIDARMNKLSGNLVSLAETMGRKKPADKKKAVERIQKDTAKVKEKLSKDQVKVRLAQDIIDAMRC